MKVNRQGTAVAMGPVRIVWAYLHEPRKKEGKEQPEYGCAVLISKSEDGEIAKAIEEACLEAASGKFGAKGADVYRRQRYPVLKDGDAPENAERWPWMAGHWYANLTSKNAPKCFDQWQKPCEGGLYGGCWCYVSANFAAYDSNGNKGVGGYLNMVMKQRDDAPIGGSASTPEDSFKGLAGWGEAPAMPAMPGDDDL